MPRRAVPPCGLDADRALGATSDAGRRHADLLRWDPLVLSTALISWDALLVLFAATGELLALVFVYRVLVRGGAPASTLLWMAVILLTPWFGLLLYYLLPRRLQLRRLRRLRQRGERFRTSRGERSAALPAAKPPGSGLQTFLADTDGAGLSFGNRLRWLPEASDFSAGAAEAIAAARVEVALLVYIFRADRAGRQLLALLAAAAQRGVRVRLLYDSIGSFGLGDGDLAALRAAGGRAEAFLPLFWKKRPFTINLRNHRKLLVVDGEVGYVGGRNVGDEYFTDRVGRERRWLDAMLEVRGPAVADLREVFAEDWFTATEEVLPELDPSPAAAPAAGAAVGGLAVVCSGPDREQSDLWFATVQAIAEARTSVDLCSPYLVPPAVLLFGLQLAAARGVRVRVHTNGPRTEALILYHAQRSHYARMLAAGIEIYETTDDYNHAKLLVVDGRVVMVGSANMDLRSAHLNFEIATVAVDAPELGAAVLATLDERRQRERRVGPEHLPKQPLRRAFDGFCGLWSPLL